MSDPLSKIDTQGLSGPSKKKYDPKKDTRVFSPMPVMKHNIITDELKQEIKNIIIETLDEYNGTKKLSV